MSGMVEKRGISYWLTHVGLSSGVLVLFFPLSPRRYPNTKKKKKKKKNNKKKNKNKKKN